MEQTNDLLSTPLEKSLAHSQLFTSISESSAHDFAPRASYYATEVSISPHLGHKGQSFAKPSHRRVADQLRSNISGTAVYSSNHYPSDGAVDHPSVAYSNSIFKLRLTTNADELSQPTISLLAGRSKPSNTISSNMDIDSDAESHISDLSGTMSDSEPMTLIRRKAQMMQPCPTVLASPAAPQVQHHDTQSPQANTQRLNPQDIEPNANGVTRDTLENPRSVMSMNELERLLVQRDLPRRKPTEDHATIVARLNEIDNGLTGKELNALLKEVFLATSFPRAEKIRRLQKYDADHSAQGLKGVKSTDLGFKQLYEGYKIYGAKG